MSESTLREHGLRIGHLEAGAANAITDVAGVRVGHVTVVRDEPEPPVGRGLARTGVTAILPGAGESVYRRPVPAGSDGAQRRRRADGLPPDLGMGADRDADLPHLDDGRRARLRRRRRACVRDGCGGRRRRGRDPGRRRVRRQLAQRRAHRAGRGGGRRPRRPRCDGRRRRPGLRRRRDGDDRARLEGRHRLVQPPRPRGRCDRRRARARELRLGAGPADRRRAGLPDDRRRHRSATAGRELHRRRRDRRAAPARAARAPRAARRASVSRARARLPITGAARSSSPSRPPPSSAAARQRRSASIASPSPTRTSTRSSPRSSRRPRRRC